MARNIKKKKKGSNSRKGSKSRASTSNSEELYAKVWQPGVDKVEDGEELQCDPTAYDCLHGFHIGWPCLSFDILHDSLGLVRTEFPHTIYSVAGTQAEKASNNAIGLLRLSNVTGKKRKLLPSEDDSDSDSSSDEDMDADDINAEHKSPSLQVRMVAHQGCVNRVRCMLQKPFVVATWGDNGYVQVWDFNEHLNSLVGSDPRVSNGASSLLHQPPLKVFTGHKDEGFAIDWSPTTTGRLLSGDCKSCIHLWEPTADGWNIDRSPYVGHTASVEDLQWSPTEANVFASCSVDGKIAIWDARVQQQPAICRKAHESDVNVISWNRLASCMIASGSDDGSFSIWDLRSFKEDPLVAHFKYHKQPITSIEWSPHESSTLAVSSADNQLTIWDFSLERDLEEEEEFKAKMDDKVNAPEDLPPQLLFVHQGQKNLKELHWHPQIPGFLMSTSADGFNIFKPTNVEFVS